MLDEGLSRKVTLVSAPAGYGKTTLVASWARQLADPSQAGVSEARRRCGWLSLDESDNDPARFLAYLVGALQRADERIGASVPAVKPTPGAFATLQGILNELINDLTGLSPGDSLVALVLDDFHLITRPAIHRALAFLIEHQPAQLHLIIMTREDPPLPIPRLRARQEMAEIRQADLRFTSKETAVLLNEVMGLTLIPAQVEALEARTEGWAAGLHLAALSLHGQPDVDHFVRSFTGSNRYILDYLIEEVFRRQSSALQTFLLHTSILDRLCAPLCAAVLGAPPNLPESLSGSTDHQILPDANPQSTLEHLQRTNLFIMPLDETREWFRYHHLFADLLRQRLRHQQHDTGILHRRAAQWLAANGYPEEAIGHYLAASAWEPGVALILEQSDTMLRRGENARFLQWVQALPDDIAKGSPQLCLDCSWALALSGQVDEAAAYLQVAEAAAQQEPALYGSVLSAQIHLARARHDLPQTISLSRRALALIPAEDHGARSALSLNLGIAHWHLGDPAEAAEAFAEASRLAQIVANHHVDLLANGFLGLARAAGGQLGLAADQLREALNWGAAYPASSLLHMAQAAIHYERNQLEEAGTLLEQSVRQARRSGNSELESSAHRLNAMVKQAQGRSGAARAALDQAIQVAGETASPFIQARNADAAVCIALAQGDVTGAEQWTEKVSVPAAWSPLYPLLFLAPVRLHLAMGDRAAARAQLASQYDRAVAGGWLVGQVEVRLLQALAASIKTEALAFLTDALVLSQQESLVRSFLDKGSDLLPLLHMAAARDVVPDFARQLLAEARSAEPKDPMRARSARQLPSDDPLEPLSERELAVLRLLAQGHTNREIAQTLVISVNTVKSHLKSVYGKLGVHNRRQAVAQARVLHLLHPGQ